MVRNRGARAAIVAGVCAVVAVGLTVSAGCVRVPIDREVGSPTSTDSAVESGAATRADVKISMGAGELFVGSGAASGDLMEADFDFQPASWEPEVSYEVRGERGVLEIKQPSVSGFPRFDGVTNRWDLALSEELPIDLEVNLGAGTGELLLGGLDLRDLR
ncbi:MAG: toast rack family protein, partial [Actinomycetota bacterium]|nr:toast rack family protein [Actinomycetota bacterium]